ncbi:MAG TPA: Uma2 family endonuclease [Termitinemataceae bacterium]|nr:Uma2 family endonuclease [Termitinemataceae bacterium]HOM24398.1 Uma2 family endonuclease [Termitinemataceae bacterium]HPQ01526.1 Uma2 family endonuclease [Termitinemataceae bacterium]
MPETHGTSALKEGERFTIADWKSWPPNERWELISGVAYNMSPAPRVSHQEKAFNLARHLGNYLEGKPCQVFIAPLDVFLEEASDTGDTVVEPDVLVVCDPTKVQEDGIHGAPDFIAEVLSESTAHKDLGIKRELYERVGVREYWIIHSDTSFVYQYVWNDGRFGPVREYRPGEVVQSVVFPDFFWTCPPSTFSLPR